MAVALINMPITLAICPSPALGLLKACLEKENIACDDLYANLDFAVHLGLIDYHNLVECFDAIAGNFVFAGHMKCAADDSSYIEEAHKRFDENSFSYRSFSNFTQFEEKLMQAREYAGTFLEWFLNSRDWNQYELIGFSSNFQQQAAVLAFAERLKEQYPQTKTIVGGSNVWGNMGLEWLKYSPAIDFVCLGEGESAFPEIIHELRSGGDPLSIPGIAGKYDRTIRSGPQEQLLLNLDELPIPNYHSYFVKVNEYDLKSEALWEFHSIPFESSRGCWWGQKSHCVFCGLNGTKMAFRSKSPDRVIAELKELSARHMALSFQAVDNIMDRKYLSTVLLRLDKMRADFDLFFEIKSNNSLAEIRTMARGGVRHIQPGIESLNTDILKLLRKGVSKLQNVFLLKWARYFKIKVDWHLLTHVPGASEGMYLNQLHLADLIVHFDPPSAVTPIRLQRFSPLHTDPARFGIKGVRANKLFRHIFPSILLDCDEVSFFFDHDHSEDDHPVFEALRKEVNRWKKMRASGASLIYSWSPDQFIRIEDRRSYDTLKHYVYKVPSAQLYEVAGTHILTAPEACNALRDYYNINIEAIEAKAILDLFVKRGLAIEENGRYLTLAIPTSCCFNDLSDH